jgi:UDP-2,3-diacylglucosamine pyrophosphatase LpxH
VSRPASSAGATASIAALGPVEARAESSAPKTRGEQSRGQGSIGQRDLVRESLLVLSDVHLGSDINDRAPPGGASRRSRSIDADLVELIGHYARTPPSGDRWRIVIAGDFIDFIGISITADSRSSGGLLDTEPSEEELAHGLGNAEDHARIKLRRVADRHREVFASLADFVARGNTMTLVHGNHDIEFHWEAVKSELKDQLAALAPLGSIAEIEAFKNRIEFNPWFFYVGGVAYIEHGHQYDAYCATDYVMAPLSPFDPRRIARNFSDTLLRFVVRSTLGLKEHGHDGKGMLDYITFGIGLGFRGLVKLGLDFARAVIELFRLRRAYFTDAARTLREEHDRRVALLAEATRIGVDRLRSLAALQVPPITRSIRGILGSVLLDRLALALISVMALLVVAIIGARHGHFLWAGVSVIVAWLLLNRYLAKQRKIDPDDQLVERAAHLARLFPAAFVVMGHTHVPMRVPVNAGNADEATYINVGSWAEEEAEDEAHVYRAARTHLVIRHDAEGARAEFLAWSSEGPRTFVGPWKPTG